MSRSPVKNIIDMCVFVRKPPADSSTHSYVQPTNCVCARKAVHRMAAKDAREIKVSQLNSLLGSSPTSVRVICQEFNYC